MLGWIGLADGEGCVVYGQRPDPTKSGGPIPYIIMQQVSIALHINTASQQHNTFYSRSISETGKPVSRDTDKDARPGFSGPKG